MGREERPCRRGVKGCAGLQPERDARVLGGEWIVGGGSRIGLGAIGRGTTCPDTIDPDTIAPSAIDPSATGPGRTRPAP